MNFKYIFGPIISRRLGVSLGIDLLPNGVCTFDCIYCERGSRAELNIERKEYIPTKKVIKELDRFLKRKPKLDYITFSGSGEPTLHSKIDKIVGFLKQNYPEYKIALLTNASLFTDKRILERIKKIDLIVPSLDAVLESTFQTINRPVFSLSINDIINGLINLDKNYVGETWLEIFIIPGVNDTEKEIKTFKKVIDKINPQRIQLNTLDRPGVENWIQPATMKKLNQIATALGDKVEVVGKLKPRRKQKLKNKVI
ncbi:MULTISPECIES: radical SAM protein [unclassified Candidatus Frackibacter]|uniref:radical SAM protein n=1 Tax=unclassified Candidatus Frackibacter TaxID=2648818 RepID=UPI000889A61B|nr:MULTISPECIES: radical SAM protein [unclassified Candidatus Frackibacter]SDC82989.1 Wyosine [tRNA(Phe)-imidazoG37] synthetase, radical SAM superfamily [Candidatus Frackibacter sp. WG11]SEM97467.1 Wyosine [tRNA(Phe)-imidazoG37] synthetase, radical SAM superfamily [Candidatus Frackibacter sp. WG12]SFM06218.1 Wyosine [tRNA(Phe)-imidazoG37] synthetase, radical SAM superfamily [Candidatus Frackibacter sp. WG13]